MGAHVRNLSGGQNKFIWNDDSELSYTKHYGMPESSDACLIVHGNSRHAAGTSENKLWGVNVCTDKLSAVICQLNFI